MTDDKLSKLITAYETNDTRFVRDEISKADLIDTLKELQELRYIIRDFKDHNLIKDL